MKIVVGQGSCGIAAGAAKVYDGLNNNLDKSKATLTFSGCVGMCYLEPIVDIYDDDKMTRLVRVSEKDVDDICKFAQTKDYSLIENITISKDDEEFLTKQTRIALRKCGIINPEEIDDYIQSDGYTAIEKVLTTMSPEDVIETIDFINKNAMNGTILAHTDGCVPNLMVHIPEQTEFYLGQLFYFFEFACGVSGYMLGVNPFDQPGVESYKKNMFALLGKPGYEKEREELLKRL